MATSIDTRRPSINIRDDNGIVSLIDSISPLKLPSGFELHANIADALPIPGTRVIDALRCGTALWWHRTLKIVTQLPNGREENYFLKIAPPGRLGRYMCEGEYESLKALHEVSRTLAPRPYTFDRYQRGDRETYFVLCEFREVGEQPPDPLNFMTRLAELHRNSESPTGKFGFHKTTCHNRITQATDFWHESWEVVYRKQLSHMIELDRKKNGDWPEFYHVCDLILGKVVPRLLSPLQSDGRTIKPCLVHGDLWDEKTATDMETGEPFIFDAASFYAHNEYEMGNWRGHKYKLSSKIFIRNYKRQFPVSEPEAEWEDRNRLYALRYNLGYAVLIPTEQRRQRVLEDMIHLCEKFCQDELKAALATYVISSDSDFDGKEEDDEEEEEEEEEEEKDEEEE